MVVMTVITIGTLHSLTKILQDGKHNHERMNNTWNESKQG